MKVCIDPGHAGYPTDPGACNIALGLQEADINLALAEKLARYLMAAGMEILLTRTARHDAASDSLAYRVQLANDWEADIFISIHCNSFSDVSARGTEIWTAKGVTAGDQLAALIIEYITAALPEVRIRADWSDGDSDKEADFYVLRYTQAPACLIEAAFISHAEEARWLADEEWQQCLAQAVAGGIIRYFTMYFSTRYRYT